MRDNERMETIEVLKHLQGILDVTRVAGSEEHNHIQELKLIDRKGCKNMFGEPLMDGLYVRPVWSDNPDRDDGYYDINVEGDSPWGVACDVMQWLKKKF